MSLTYFRYPIADDIPEKYMRQLFEKEVEVWGVEPFWEYKLCDNLECRRVFSIEDVHGEISKMHEKIYSWDDFCCRECSSETSYMYKSEEFYDIMKQYVKWNVSAVLLIWDEDTLQGFWVLSQGTIESVAHWEFQTRWWSYNPNDVIQKLSENIFSCNDAKDEDIVCFHQIHVSGRVRDAAISYKLMQELFFLTGEIYNNLPVVWETRYDSRFYPVSRSMWFDDIFDDPHGYVIQSIWKYAEVLQFLSHNTWFSDFNKEMLGFKRNAKKILEKHPDYSGIKYYK